jgi:carbon starvation protein
MFGLPSAISACVITMCVSALAMTTIDSVARIGRMSFQELFAAGEGEEESSFQKLCQDKYFSTSVTLVLGLALCQAGYMSIWPLFGAANQLLSALVLISLAVFLKVTGRKGWMLYVPMVFMFLVTMSALVMSVWGIFSKLSAGNFVLMVDGLQLVLALALMTLAVLVVKHCGRELLGREEVELAHGH